MSKFLPESMHRLNVPGMEDSFVYTTATMGVHQLLKIPANKGLSTALGFAYDLVRSSVITTTVDLAAGKEEARTHIERPTDDEIARFVTLAETNPGFIEDAYWANLAAARVLGEPDGSAAKLTDAYKAKILDANQTDLNPARRDLADD